MSIPIELSLLRSGSKAGSSWTLSATHTNPGPQVNGSAARWRDSQWSFLSPLHSPNSAYQLDRFMLGISKISTKTCQRRFLRAWEKYCIGVGQQAELRSKAFVPDFETYFQIRRATVGTEPSFVLAEMDMDIPDEIRFHPTIQELETLVTDLVSIVNVSRVPQPAISCAGTKRSSTL